MMSSDEAACMIQAYWRSYTTRKKILQTRFEYEMIVKEIEGNLVPASQYIVKWPSKHLCYPKFVLPNNEIVSKEASNRPVHMNSQESIKGGGFVKPQDVGTQTSQSAKSETEEYLESQSSLDLSGDDSKGKIENGKDFRIGNRKIHNENFEVDSRRKSIESPSVDCLSDTPGSVNNELPMVKTLFQHEEGEISNFHGKGTELRTVKHKRKNESIMLNVDSPVEQELSYSENEPIIENIDNKGDKLNTEMLVPEEESQVNQRKFLVFRKQDRNDESEEKYTGPELLTDSWDTEKSFGSVISSTSVCGNTPNEECLRKEENELMLELLWIQQAIESRKEYLRMKDENS